MQAPHDTEQVFNPLLSFLTTNILFAVQFGMDDFAAQI